MIFTALFNLIFAIVVIVLSPLLSFDDVVLVSGLQNSLTNFTSGFHALNVFIPVDTLFSILVYILYIEGAIWVYKGIMWLIRRIPGQG